MSNCTITVDRVREAAANGSPEVRQALKTLVPEAFPTHKQGMFVIHRSRLSPYSGVPSQYVGVVTNTAPGKTRFRNSYGAGWYAQEDVVQVVPTSGFTVVEL